MTSKNRRNLFIIIMLGFIAYCNIFSNQFIFDDSVLIVKNENIKHFRYIPKLFAGEFFDIDMRFNKGGYYRPLILLSFFFDYTVWKLNSFGFHLTNLLFHLLNACLIYFLIFNIFSLEFVALVTSLLFTLHPVQTSSVAYISGRTDVLALFFMLVFLFLGVRFFKDAHSQTAKKYFYGCLLCFTLALLCKEVAIITPLFLLLYLFIFQKNEFKGKRFFFTFLTLGIIAFLYLIIRGLVLKSFQASSAELFFDKLLIRLFLIPKIIITYILILLFPYNLRFERFVPLSPSLLNYLKYFSSWVYIFLFMVFLYSYFLSFKKSKNVFFALSFFCIALLPGSQLIPIVINNKLFTPEHFLYIPSVGFFLLIAFYLEKLKNQNRKAVIGILAVVCLVFISLSFSRNRIFKNNLSFYQHTLQKSSQTARVHNNLGNAYFEAGRLKEALQEYRLALEIDSSYAKTYINIGNLYTRQGLYDKAIAQYLKAAKLSPFDQVLLCNIGVAYDKQHKYKEAEKFLKKSVEIKPNYKEAYDNLGTVYHNQGLLTEAIRAYKQALKIDFRYASAHYHLGNMYMYQRKYEEAIAEFKTALKYKKDLVDAYNNLGIVYQKLEKIEASIKVYKTALKYNKDHLQLHNNLGAAYDKKNLLDEALAEFMFVREKAPADSISYYNIGNILLKKGEYKKALIEFNKAKELAPKDIDTALSLSFIYDKLGEVDKALKEIKRIARLYPRSKLITRNLRRLQSRKGRQEKKFRQD